MASIFTQSAEERQRAYEAVGLRSWEIAEWEAEVSGQKKKDALGELERTVGAPKRVGSEGQLREFTRPDLSKRTFTEGGDLRSFTLSPFITPGNRFIPSDRRRLEQLGEIRAEGALGGQFENYKTL